MLEIIFFFLPWRTFRGTFRKNLLRNLPQKPSAEPSTKTFPGSFRRNLPRNLPQTFQMGKGRTEGPEPSGILPESFRKTAVEQNPSAKPSTEPSAKTFHGSFRKNLPRNHAPKKRMILSIRPKRTFRGTFRKNLPQRPSAKSVYPWGLQYLPQEPSAKTFRGSVRDPKSSSEDDFEHKHCMLGIYCLAPLHTSERLKQRLKMP